MARSTRRALLRFGGFGLFATVILTRPWTHFRGVRLGFSDLGTAPPFRLLEAEGATYSGGGADPLFVGLAGGAETQQSDATVEALRGRFCETLLGDWQEGGPVPVTYFTDIRCPNCLTIERNLDQVAEGDPTAFDLRVRQFPVFGRSSEVGARMILAAELQAAGEAMRQRLRRGPTARTTAQLAAQAEALDLDPERFVQDVNGAEISGRLAEDRAIARILGLPGTPSLVLGRSVVIGVQSTRVLEALIELERQEGRVPCR